MWVVYWSKLRFACARLLCNSGIVSIIVVLETFSFPGWVNSTLFDFHSNLASRLTVSPADTTSLLLRTFCSLCIFGFNFSIVTELLISFLLLPLGCRVQCLVLVINYPIGWGTTRADCRRNVCLITSSLVCLVPSEFINTDKFKRVWINYRITLFLARCIQLFSFFLLLLLWIWICFSRRVI